MTAPEGGSVIIVPGTAETNSGDQALLAEAIALVREAGWTGTVYVLADEDAPPSTALPAHDRLRPILPHPRRGRHEQRDYVGGSKSALLGMMARAARDFLWGQLVLLTAPLPGLARLLVRGPARASYDRFRGARAVVVKGGGFLHAHGEMTAPYYVWYQLFYLRLAQRLGKPVIVLPNSFGPFRGATVQHQIRAVLGRCRVVAARERESARVLGALLGRDVPTFPDMAYRLEPAPRSVGEEVCRAHGVPLGEKPCVAFTVRPYRFPGAQDPATAYANYLQAVAELVHHVSDAGFHPVLVTHVAGPSAHEDDRIAIRRLVELLGGVTHTWIDEHLDCRTVKAVYGCMDFLVGTRFHSVIFAQGMGVPCMAIAYGGNKATGAMADMGLDQFVVPIGEVTGARLCEMFTDLVAQRQEATEKAARYVAGASDQMAALRDELAACTREASAP